MSVHAPEELRLGPGAGDLIAYCKAGWSGARTVTAHTVDVAPTVAELLGLSSPAGWYDGRSRA